MTLSTPSPPLGLSRAQTRAKGQAHLRCLESGYFILFHYLPAIFVCMEDTGDLINRFLNESDAARKELAAMQKKKIDSEALQVALVERLGLSDTTQLIFQNLDKARILKVLEGFDFPRVVAATLMKINILPDGLSLLGEAEGKVSNQVWRVHKNDVDFFPSDPHAHNPETGITLDLSNGWTYKKRACCGKIKKKFLLALRAQLEDPLRRQGIELPALAV